MNPQTVVLPRLVGGRAVVNAALVPYREGPVLGVSFRDVRSVSDVAVHEVLMSGTNHGTRPLHLLHISADVRAEVESIVEREPMLRGYVLFQPLPEVVADPEETTDVRGGSYTREQAAELVTRLSLWIGEG